jgi:hypothetical protein
MNLSSSEPLPFGSRATKTLERATSKAMCLCLSVLACCCVTLAQAPTQGPTPGPPSGLKTLSFGFERKTFTRLELVQANPNTTTIPTESYAYRSEGRSEPERGREYYQYQPEEMEQDYVVLRVENQSGKTIKKVDWEFTYPRFNGGTEVVFQPVRSRLKILPDRVASLAQKLPQDGSHRRHLHSRGEQFIGRSFGREHRKDTGIYPFEARIRRVEFSDGTSWQAVP